MDGVERAHLRDAGDRSHVMYRYAAPAEFEGLVRRAWLPVWSVPAGEEAPQRVLQYPVCLVVITGDYARFYGVTSGLSVTTLTGDGWAAGLMLAPAAGALVARGSVADYTDRFVELTDVLAEGGVQLIERVRRAMTPNPHAAEGHQAALDAYWAALRPVLPVDPEGKLINRIVDFVEGNPDVLRVAQVCEVFGLSERALQRLVHRRVGLPPKWLIQRRRLQEAAERLRTDTGTVAEVAAMLGYADAVPFRPRLLPGHCRDARAVRRAPSGLIRATPGPAPALRNAVLRSLDRLRCRQAVEHVVQPLHRRLAGRRQPRAGGSTGLPDEIDGVALDARDR